MGQLVKLCNNMIAATTTVALSEVMVMGRSAGLDTKTMYDVLTSGSADSHMLNSYFPRTVFGESRPTGFSLDFMVKDLDLFLDTGNKTPVPMLLSGMVRQVFRIAQDQGLGARDSCHVVEFYENLAGVQLKF
jgi:3-hydroxyisobutyrate dehydrogenase-like beta-hydroxyacid dehydrogenase